MPIADVDYAPDGAYGREWLRDRLDDIADDGLVELDGEGETVAGFRR